MTLPKFFLVSSTVTETQLDKVLEAMSFTPVEMALVANPADVELAKKLTDQVTGLHRPIVIVADFKDPLTVITDDGKVLSVALETANV